MAGVQTSIERHQSVTEYPPLASHASHFPTFPHSFPSLRPFFTLSLHSTPVSLRIIFTLDDSAPDDLARWREKVWRSGWWNEACILLQTYLCLFINCNQTLTFTIQITVGFALSPNVDKVLIELAKEMVN